MAMEKEKAGIIALMSRIAYRRDAVLIRFNMARTSPADSAPRRAALSKARQT
jgi:hypothetical protein